MSGLPCCLRCVHPTSVLKPGASKIQSIFQYNKLVIFLFFYHAYLIIDLPTACLAVGATQYYRTGPFSSCLPPSCFVHPKRSCPTRALRIDAVGDRSTTQTSNFTALLHAVSSGHVFRKVAQNMPECCLGEEGSSCAANTAHTQTKSQR